MALVPGALLFDLFEKGVRREKRDEKRTTATGYPAGLQGLRFGRRRADRMVPPESWSVVQEEGPVVPLEEDMRLICPSCGAVSSADTFANDDLCRQALTKVAALPGPLPQATLGYVSLFRTGTSPALGWKKVLRLVTEIEAMAAKGYVHVQGRVDRSCTPSTWARGMEQMVEQRAFLRLPMESHGYLEKVVWDLADKADARHEASKQVSAVRHQRPVTVAQMRGVDPLEKARAEWDRTHGTPQVKGFDELAKIIGGISNVEE